MPPSESADDKWAIRRLDSHIRLKQGDDEVNIPLEEVKIVTTEMEKML